VFGFRSGFINVLAQLVRLVLQERILNQVQDDSEWDSGDRGRVDVHPFKFRMTVRRNG
jgi:hypothetical protein